MTLWGVSCLSANDCTAVGGDRIFYPYPLTHSLVERYNGKKWAIQRTPGSPLSDLYGVSCVSPTICTAVGLDDAGSIAERWNGQHWSIQSTPATPGYILAGVSCPSPIICTAVGSQEESVPDPFGPPGSVRQVDASLAERWTASARPTPPVSDRLTVN